MRPADRHPEAATRTLRDPDASPRAVHNALVTLGLPDDAFTEAVRRAHVRPAPDTPPGYPGTAAVCAAALIVMALVTVLCIGGERWMTARNGMILDRIEERP